MAWTGLTATGLKGASAEAYQATLTSNRPQLRPRTSRKLWSTQSHRPRPKATALPHTLTAGSRKARAGAIGAAMAAYTWPSVPMDHLSRATRARIVARPYTNELPGGADTPRRVYAVL